MVRESGRIVAAGLGAASSLEPPSAALRPRAAKRRNATITGFTSGTDPSWSRLMYQTTISARKIGYPLLPECGQIDMRPQAPRYADASAAGPREHQFDDCRR